MSTKAEWRNQMLRYFDPALGHETTQFMAPVQFYDDFAGAFVVIPDQSAPESGCTWVKKIVGAAPPTVAGVADAANGVIQCALTSASQKQDAGLYMGDQRLFDVTKGLVFEARACVSVTPTDVAEVVMGLFDNWSDGLPDSATYRICFNLDGSTTVRCHFDDNVTPLDVSSGVTAGTTAWKVYRIDCSSVADVKFYIDGVEVAASTTFPYAATGANAILQPYFGVYKASGTGVGTVQVDYCKIWQKRS